MSDRDARLIAAVAVTAWALGFAMGAVGHSRRADVAESRLSDVQRRCPVTPADFSATVTF